MKPIHTFDEIQMIDFSKPVKARQCRYRWIPRDPRLSDGISFYTSMDSAVAMDRTGSVCDLRLDYAISHKPYSRRYLGVYEFYCDPDGISCLTPIVARLAHGRGFLAGWTMGEGMIASLETRTIHAEIEDAALAAYEMAEHDAERMRDESNNEEEDEVEA